MKTLEDILKASSSILDLSYETPAGDELTTRIGYVNLAVEEACEYAKLPELKKEYIVYATGQTIPLPSDFKELHENPHLYSSSGSWVEYQEIEAEDKYQHSSGEKYCYVLGNRREGFNLFLNNFSGGTVSILYQKFPEGFATLSDVSELSSVSYLVHRTVYYVLFSRGDDKFPLAKAESEKYLANMVGRRSLTAGGQGKTTPVGFVNPLK